MVTLLLLGLSTLVSEDLACLAAGLLIARNSLGFIPATLACFVGIFIGDVGLFLAGRYIGRPALSVWPLKNRIQPYQIEQTSAWFTRRGSSIVFLSRFLPGSRLPTYFISGLLQTSFWNFCGYFALACVVWTPLLVGASMVFGQAIVVLFKTYVRYAFPIFGLSLFLLYELTRAARALCSYQNRRIFVSSWRRLVRWEFWPMWFFYPPVIMYVLYQAVRYRSLTLFTASNPAIPGGGFVGESKSDILRALSGYPEYVAPFILIESGRARARFLQAKGHIQETGYPVVLKPDAGERGSGVCIARDDADVESYFANTDARTILQEYIAGYEFGVFYVRYPKSEKGFIYAITDKRFPTVTGDGKRTLEELILADNRAVCMAPLHLKNHKHALSSIPANGEIVRLVEIGTHCRGSLFLDGGHLKTPQMEDKIDEVSKGFEGFYFGRYDIRTPSIEDFQAGRNFKIVELNGVTSEATSIYDPKHGLIHAYRVLMKQWKMAFEIGAENRERGAIPTSLRDLFQITRDSKESSFPTTKQRKEDILWN